MATCLRDLLKRSALLVKFIASTRVARLELMLMVSRWRVKKNGGYLLSVYGIWLRDRWDDTTYRYCVLGEYGFFYSEWLKQQEDCIFLDIGSNVGLYAVLACKNPGIKSIHAFEPVPATFEYLADNLRRNTDRGHAHQVGISSEATELTIKMKQGHSGVSTLRSTGIIDKEFDFEIQVKVVGPEFLNEVIDTDLAEKIAVKIDVEGHEQVVIETLMRSRIWPQVWNIYYEVNERFLDPNAVLFKLQAEGFEVISKLGSERSYDLMVQRRVPVACV